MNALALASFVASDRGAEYASVHRYWGSDPAEGIDDPILAYSFRHALAMQLDDEPKPDDPVERTRQAAKALKEGRWPVS